MALVVKNLPIQEAQETQVPSLGQEGPLEEAVATRSSALAWRIPWTEEPGGLQSGVSESRMRLSDSAHTELIHTRVPVSGV